MGQRRQIDDSDTVVIVQPGASAPALRRITTLSVSFAVFCAATVAVAGWTIRVAPDPGNAGEAIAVLALFTLTLAALGAALGRDYHNRRNIQTEQMMRNWMVYQHEETRKVVSLGLQQAIRELQELNERNIAALLAEVRFAAERTATGHRDVLNGLRALEGALPELAAKVEWVAWAKGVKAGEEATEHDGNQPPPRQPQLRVVQNGGARRAAGRDLNASVPSA